MLRGHTCRARTRVNPVEGEVKDIQGTENILAVQKTHLKNLLMNRDQSFLSSVLELGREHFPLCTGGILKEMGANYSSTTDEPAELWVVSFGKKKKNRAYIP